MSGAVSEICGCGFLSLAEVKGQFVTSWVFLVFYQGPEDGFRGRKKYRR